MVEDRNMNIRPRKLLLSVNLVDLVGSNPMCLPTYLRFLNQVDPVDNDPMYPLRWNRVELERPSPTFHRHLSQADLERLPLCWSQAEQVEFRLLHDHSSPEDKQLSLGRCGLRKG